MRTLFALFVLLGCAVIVPAAARADALGGDCPHGQHYQTNPVPPGAMHHGGGQCVPDPHSGPCTVASPGAGPAAGVLFALVGLVLTAALRRRRA